MKIFAIFSLSLLFSIGANAQTYSEWVEKSFDELEKNDLAGAETSLQNALKEEPANPNNFALFTNLGTIQRQLGKPKEALLSYSTALNRYPKNKRLLENRASIYVELGETEKAIIDFSEILTIEPNDQEALYYRGLLYLEEDNYLSAENDFARMIEINDKTVKGRLGYAIMEKMRGNYDESERIYNFLISKLPRDWSLYEGRADLYFQMGKNARAMADINKITMESEPSAFLYVLRGKIKLSQYEKESAMKDFTKAIEMGYDAEKLQELIDSIN